MASKSHRPCEICASIFRAKSVEQRTCGRACGVELRRRAGNLGNHAVPRRCQVPIGHPARWFGDSSPVRYSTCEWCAGAVVQTPYRTRRYCSDYCCIRMKRARRQSRACATLEWQTWTWGAFVQMAAKFGYRCAYCGEKPDRLDPDHVVPLAKGGPNTIANLLPTCLPCNSDKRDLSLADWSLDRQRRGLPPRATAWATADHRYTHLTSVLAAA